jgi:hypothetical protein
LHSGSNKLPWTNLIFFGTSASVQRAAIIGRDAACSRAVNGRSGRGIGDPIFAVRHVKRRLDAGNVGRPTRSIVRPRTAGNGGGNKVNAIASGNETGKLRQLTRRRRARVSAHNRAAKIPPIGRAIGRAATSFLPFPMNIRASVFAAWCADWRCVACWTAKRATRHGVVGRVVSL